ncbi:HNH endonuclease [Burkholderia cenocepacia]
MASLFKRPTGLTVFDHDEPYEDLYDPAEHEALPVEVPPVQVEPGSLQDLLFSQLVEGLRASMRHTESWMVRYLADQQSGVCAYCGLTLSVTGNRIDGAPRAMADLLVPLALGGTALEENRVLCCAECQNAKGGRDWLAFGRATDPVKLLARRREALLDGANHVLPLSVKGTDDAMHALRQRWAFPRFRVLAQAFGEVGYFGWDLRGLPNERGGAVRLRLRFEFGARDVSQSRFALFEVPPDRWYEAAWALVEENAVLVRPSMTDRERTAFPPFAPSSLALQERECLAPGGWHEHYERWHILLSGERWVQEARRVARWSMQAKPGQRAVEEQRRRALREKPLNDALAGLAQRLEDVRTGRAEPVASGAGRSVRSPGESAPLRRPLNPGLAQRQTAVVARHAAFLDALREGKPLPVREHEVVPVAPDAVEPSRAPLPLDVQDRLAALRERLLNPTSQATATGRTGDAVGRPGGVVDDAGGARDDALVTEGPAWGGAA